VASEEMRDRMDAVLRIAKLFGPSWRLPMAIYFAALISEEPEKMQEHESSDDNVFLASFRSNLFSGSCSPFLYIYLKKKFGLIGHCLKPKPDFPIYLDEIKSYSPSKVKIFDPDSMPELKRVREILRVIHKDFQLRAALG
jgi:hypothetical protein